MRKKVDNPDVVISRLAARQHGVVSRAQLIEAGIGDAATSRRVERGRLHRLHRGVYAVGHSALSFRGKCLAAVLACGGDAVLSHHSAAALWQLLDPRRGDIHVTISSAAGRIRRKGIQLHRLISLRPDQMTREYDIPVTTPARTLADLKGEVEAPTWRRAVRQAEVLGLRTGLDAPSAPTSSELEDRFLGLCHRHRLPTPEVNVRVGRWEVDFLWRGQRLVVETDGYRYHRGRTAFEDDHVRDLDLRNRGLDVLRLTYEQVTNEPSQVAKVLRRELERHSKVSPLTS